MEDEGHLLLLQGPAGGGKSGVYAQLLRAGVAQVVADYTRIYVALTGVVRDPDTGLYPVRLATDAVVAAGTVTYAQATIVRHALGAGLSTIVTTSRRGQERRWQQVAEETNAAFSVQTVDPGRQVVTERLASQTGGVLSDECETAIRRWYR